MSMLFKTKDERKISRRDSNIQKAMIIPVDIHEMKISLLQFNQKMHVN